MKIHKHKDGFTYRPDRFKASPQESYLLARALRVGELNRSYGRHYSKCQSERNSTRISAHLGK